LSPGSLTPDNATRRTASRRACARYFAAADLERSPQWPKAVSVGAAIVDGTTTACDIFRLVGRRRVMGRTIGKRAIMRIRQDDQMKSRRGFLIALGGTLAWPRFAVAQQAERTYRVGWLSSQSRTEPYNMAFEQRLRELGFDEGRNLVIEFRNAQGRIERLPALAEDLARRNCDVFLAPETEALLVAIKQASRDTPIVMVALDYDPVATGHIASLVRPGGRITGMTHIQSELPAKRVELLKELLPSARRIAVLADSSNTGQLASAEAGAKRLGVELQVLEFKRAPYNYDNAFAEAVRAKAEALLALGSANFVSARRQITELALRHRLPSMFHHSLWVEFGGLLSYGPNFVSTFRRAAEQVGMVLNGRKPGEMPVEQPTSFELVINLKSAKALGLTMPPSLLLRADKVIE
jgi:putative ABC transport system substrate-binding protein